MTRDELIEKIRKVEALFTHSVHRDLSEAAQQAILPGGQCRVKFKVTDRLA